MMKNRKASDRMAECIIEMVHEYKKTIEHLNGRIEVMKDKINYWKGREQKAVEGCDIATGKLEEIADIIAGITEYKDSNIQIFLSDILPANGSKLDRLFTLLDIPMAATEVKEGD